MCVMTNSMKGEIKWQKLVSNKKQVTFSVLQVLGTLLLVFAAADFVLSWMGVNLTPFMGLLLDFLIFGVLGTV